MFVISDGIVNAKRKTNVWQKKRSVQKMPKKKLLSRGFTQLLVGFKQDIERGASVKRLKGLVRKEQRKVARKVNKVSFVLELALIHGAISHYLQTR